MTPLERVRVQCKVLWLPTLAQIAEEIVVTAVREN